jgi:hypothetical protein
MHERLRETLNVEFPIVTLFEYPTVQSLARHLDSPRDTKANGEQWRDRARLQKQALAQMRPKAKREGL